MNDGGAADLVIRAAEFSDAPALASLMIELGYETSRAEMEIRLKSILHDSRYQTLVALRDEKICGMIGTFCHPTYEHNDHSGRILALVVSEGNRKSGAGRRLVAAAENDFAQRNVRRIAVDTRLTREEAHQFYEAVGYQRNGFRFVKDLTGEAG